MKIYDYKGAKNISGNRIHQARTRMRLSEADLAAQMQINGVIIERKAISKIETGDRFIADYELLTFAKVFVFQWNGLRDRSLRMNRGQELVFFTQIFMCSVYYSKI